MLPAGPGTGVGSLRRDRLVRRHWNAGTMESCGSLLGLVEREWRQTECGDSRSKSRRMRPTPAPGPAPSLGSGTAIERAPEMVRTRTGVSRSPPFAEHLAGLTSANPGRLGPISGAFSAHLPGPRDGAGSGADAGRMPRDFERESQQSVGKVRAQLSRLRSHTIHSFRYSSGDAGGGPGAASPHLRPAPRATTTKLVRPSARSGSIAALRPGAAPSRSGRTLRGSTAAEARCSIPAR